MVWMSSSPAACKVAAVVVMKRPMMLASAIPG